MLTLSVLAIILSISSLGIILLYYCCCREHERYQYRGDGGFAVKYDNTNSCGSIALEEINKDECQLDNLSEHNYEEIPSARVSFEDIYIDATIEDQNQLDNLSDHNYEEIPSARVSLEDIYIDDTIEDQKKYMDNVSDNERIYYTLEDVN